MYNNLTDKESDFTKPPKEEKEELYPGTFNEEAVKEVQTFLNDEGIGDQYGDTLRVDGRYGAKTAKSEFESAITKKYIEFLFWYLEMLGLIPDTSN